MGQIDDIKDSLTDQQYMSIVENIGKARAKEEDCTVYSAKIITLGSRLMHNGHTLVVFDDQRVLLQMSKERYQSLRMDILRRGVVYVDNGSDVVVLYSSLNSEVPVQIEMTSYLAVIDLRPLRDLI